MCIIFPLLTTQLGYHLLCVSIVFFFLFLVLFFFVVVLIQTTFKLCGIVWQYFVCVFYLPLGIGVRLNVIVSYGVLYCLVY